MDKDLEDQLEPGWNLEDFEVGGVFDPAMLPGKGFGTWYKQAGTIEAAEKHREERQSTRAKPKRCEIRKVWNIDFNREAQLTSSKKKSQIRHLRISKKKSQINHHLFFSTTMRVQDQSFDL